MESVKSLRYAGGIRRRVRMKKVVLFFILDQFADWEAAYLSSAVMSLGKGEYSVKTVSLTKDSVQSIGGFRVLPDYDIWSAPEDYEALVLIGGESWQEEEARQVKSLVRDAAEKGRVVGGICDASVFLGAAGVLNCVKHTSNELEDLKRRAGEAYTGEAGYIRKQAVRDGNIITANGSAALEFAREVLLALGVAPEKEVQEWYRLHKLGYYEAAVPDV